METERRARWSRVSNGVGEGYAGNFTCLQQTNSRKKKEDKGREKEKRTEKQTSPFLRYRYWYWVWIPFGHSRNISGKRINLELKKKKTTPGFPKGKCVYIYLLYAHTYMWFGSEGGSFGVFGVDFGLVLSFLSFRFFLSWKVVYAICFSSSSSCSSLLLSRVFET